MPPMMIHRNAGSQPNIIAMTGPVTGPAPAIYLEVCCDDEIVILDIYDQGCGIEDIDLAMQPLYTSREDLERSGMGFTIMQSFADVFHIESRPGVGTSLHIEKRLQ